MPPEVTRLGPRLDTSLQSGGTRKLGTPPGGSPEVGYFEYIAVVPIMQEMQAGMLANFDPHRTDAVRHDLKTTFGLPPAERHAAFLKRRDTAPQPLRDGFGSLAALADAAMLIRAQLINKVRAPEPISIVLSQYLELEAVHNLSLAHRLLEGKEIPYQEQDQLKKPHTIDKPEWGLKVSFTTEKMSGSDVLYRSTATVSAMAES